MGRPKKYNREDVIEQALEVFWERGYAATSISDLTDNTGLNKKSLYNEFGSKADLFQIVYDYYNQKRAPLINLLQREPFGPNNVRDFLTKLAHDVDTRGCLFALSINEGSLLEEKHGEQLNSDFRDINKLIETNLKNNPAAALLVSAQIFAIPALGKLNVSKENIEEAINLLSEGLLAE